MKVLLMSRNHTTPWPVRHRVCYGSWSCQKTAVNSSVWKTSR